jgi:hypothetical protein
MKNWMMITGAVLGLQMGLAQAADNVLTDMEVKDGFKLLFDGNSLQSFKDNFVDFVPNDPNPTDLSGKTLDSRWKYDATCKCIALAQGNTRDVRSTKTYKDFDLRLSYLIDQNEGIFYRSNLKGNQMWETGIEYAINNVTNLGKDNPGAAYDLFAPNPIPYNVFNSAIPALSNKWNTARIVVKGDSVEHYMNEVKVVGFREHSQRFWDAYNVSKWNAESKLTNVVAGDRNSGYISEGYIGLQGDHTGKWIIKNFRISSNPCFGPINEFGSSCGSVPTSIAGKGESAPNVGFRMLSRGTDGLSIGFEQDDIKAAYLIGIDGKVVGKADLSQGGRVARFNGSFRNGLHFLKLELASGSVMQKLNLL